MFMCCASSFLFFFFNDTATTEIYTLSLHDALPIRPTVRPGLSHSSSVSMPWPVAALSATTDRKSTRLNSSRVEISYAVFCLKKKKKHIAIFIIPNLNYSSLDFSYLSFDYFDYFADI